MTSQSIVAMNIALKNLNPTAKKLIIIPESETQTNTKANIVTLKNNFDIHYALALIANVKCIGIIDSDKFNASNISELVDILIDENKAIVVRISENPVSCKVYYPSPEVGTKHIDGNYEYRYKQHFDGNIWINNTSENGYGVKVIDYFQTDYASPLTTIQGIPVISMSYLFYMYPAKALNLINWDTSNVTSMEGMFFSNGASTINGLDKFDTSKTTNMNGMFEFTNAISLDLSNFDTSMVTDMSGMFSYSDATSFDLSNFNTSQVTAMDYMFNDSSIVNLNLDSFDTSNVKSMKNMFTGSKIVGIDFSNFKGYKT